MTGWGICTRQGPLFAGPSSGRFSQRGANNLRISSGEHASVCISRRSPGKVFSEEWSGRLNQARPADFTISRGRELSLNQVPPVCEHINIIPASGHIDTCTSLQGGDIGSLPNFFPARRFEANQLAGRFRRVNIVSFQDRCGGVAENSFRRRLGIRPKDRC